MDLRRLRYFLQIAETGSFSKAAEVLHVAQSSLSQHVLLLEEELGVQLLSRHARGVVLTDSGSLLCEHARMILRDVERSRFALQNAMANPSGEVSVGLPTSACRGIFIALVSEAARRFPDVSIHVVEAMTGNLDEWLQEGRLDVALLYDPRSYEKIETFNVMTEELRLIVRTDHPLAKERAVLFADLGTCRLTLPSRPHVIRRLLEHDAARAGVELNVEINCDSLHGIIELVRSGYATIYPSFAVLDEVMKGMMVAVSVVDPAPKWHVSVALSKRTSNPRASAAIAEVIRDVARVLVEAGIWVAQLHHSGTAVRDSKE